MILPSTLLTGVFGIETVSDHHVFISIWLVCFNYEYYLLDNKKGMNENHMKNWFGLV